jgi:hypothetical protein
VLNYGMNENSELEKTWRDENVVPFQVLPLILSGQTEEIHADPRSEQSVSRQKMRNASSGTARANYAGNIHLQQERCFLEHHSVYFDLYIGNLLIFLMDQPPPSSRQIIRSFGVQSSNYIRLHIR